MGRILNNEMSAFSDYAFTSSSAIIIVEPTVKRPPTYAQQVARFLDLYSLTLWLFCRPRWSHEVNRHCSMQ